MAAGGPPVSHVGRLVAAPQPSSRRCLNYYALDFEFIVPVFPSPFPWNVRSYAPFDFPSTSSMVVSSIAIVTDLAQWSSSGPSGDPPPLTTRYDPSPGCATQWVHNPVNTTNIRSGDNSLVWLSTNGNPGGRTGIASLLSANYWKSCRPFLQPIDQPYYSPGICTRQQTIAGIEEQRFGSSRRWRGWCCDRLFAHG